LKQVPTYAIKMTEQWLRGIYFKWAVYLCSGLHQDCWETIENGGFFHYSWLIVIIAFEAWKGLQGWDFNEVPMGKCLATRYASLWATSVPIQKS